MNNVSRAKDKLNWPPLRNRNHAVRDIIPGIRISLVQTNIVKRRIIDEIRIGAAKDSVLTGVMEAPLKLLRHDLDLEGPCRSFVKVERTPAGLAHNREP